MTSSRAQAIELPSASAAATRALGARLGKVYRADAIVYVAGELGVGKSTFVQGLIGGCGVKDPVVSPSYALIETYPVAAGTICHIDLFRSTYAREWLDAGLGETISSCCLCLIEWPAKGAMLPPPDLHVGIQDGDDSARTITLQDCTAQGTRWLRAASL